jgi:uncharacterized Fe-S cluster protein YjdI/CDGSH-type Zn-finger protein
MKKTYKKDDLTIIWEPEKCIHSTKCWKGENSLRAVFNPMEKPWIKPENSEKDRIIEQIKMCPSGALSFEIEGENIEKVQETSKTTIEIKLNGPMLVHGEILIKNGTEESIRTPMTAFCRCGASQNKPYCDGSHRTIAFEG